MGTQIFCGLIHLSTNKRKFPHTKHFFQFMHYFMKSWRIWTI